MFYKKFVEACHNVGLTPTQACISAGLHRSAHNVWKKGTIPSELSICKLSNVLGVSEAYLLSEDEMVAVRMDPYVKRLANEVSIMSEADKEMLLRFAQVLNTSAFHA